MSKKLTPEELKRRVEFTVRVAPEQFERIEAMAKADRRSRNSMANLLIEWALNSMDRETSGGGADEKLKRKDGAASAL
jgi:hypothetical protein